MSDTLNEKPLPCPFCAMMPTVTFGGPAFVDHPAAKGCVLSLMQFPLDWWNRRSPSGEGAPTISKSLARDLVVAGWALHRDTPRNADINQRGLDDLVEAEVNRVLGANSPQGEDGERSDKRDAERWRWFRQFLSVEQDTQASRRQRGRRAGTGTGQVDANIAANQPRRDDPTSASRPRDEGPTLEDFAKDLAAQPSPGVVVTDEELSRSPEEPETPEASP